MYKRQKKRRAENYSSKLIPLNISELGDLGYIDDKGYFFIEIE
nr:hypothetical protein [Sulfolobus acidocaldarius]